MLQNKWQNMKQTSRGVLKKEFLEILQNSQENARTQVFSCEFCEISKDTFLHKTPLVLLSEPCIMQDLDTKTYFIYKVLLTRELVFVNQPH